MYKIIQESNLLLSLLFLTELKLFPGLKLEFLEAFFNSSQGYYYSRASLSNNKSCLELKKTSRKLHFNPGNSFRSVKNSRESNRLLSCTILYIFSSIQQASSMAQWQELRFACEKSRVQSPSGELFNDSFFIKIIFNQSGVRSPLQGVNFFFIVFINFLASLIIHSLFYFLYAHLDSCLDIN